MNFGSLFSGIGGLDLGFERAGMQCKWQVEIDPYCQKVLAKHWPTVRRHDDVKTFPPEPADDWRVDVICGGFPCQDISNAGHKVGIEGERSGLWSEYKRIVCDLRPAIVVVENVAALLVRGIDRVLGDLAESGYDADWQSIPAAAFGAPHYRERVFVLAFNTNRNYVSSVGECSESQPTPATSRDRSGQGALQEITNTTGDRLEGSHFANILHRPQSEGWASELSGSDPGNGATNWWEIEPNVGRVADGVSNRVDRLRGCGNAVVPQVAEWIGRRIVAANNQPN